MTSVRCVRHKSRGLSFNRLPPNPNHEIEIFPWKRERRGDYVARSLVAGPFSASHSYTRHRRWPVSRISFLANVNRYRQVSTCASVNRRSGRRATNNDRSTTRAYTPGSSDLWYARARSPERIDTRRGNVAGTRVLPFSRSSSRDAACPKDVLPTPFSFVSSYMFPVTTRCEASRVRKSSQSTRGQPCQR